MTEINIKIADITEETTDVIVNPANSKLLLLDGVAGQILAKGGAEIQKECNYIGFCPPGGAVITTSGDMKNTKYIIHAVGPRYEFDPQPEVTLRNTVVNTLTMVDRYELESVAMPAISTGIFGYPIKKASLVIINAIKEYAQHSKIKFINICLVDEEAKSIFDNAYQQIINQQ